MGCEGQELAEERVCPRPGPPLGIIEVAVAQEHLLPRSEGRHPKVGAAGTAESIAQVTLLKEETVIQGSQVSALPEKQARRERLGTFVGPIGIQILRVFKISDFMKDRSLEKFLRWTNFYILSSSSHSHTQQMAE